MVKVSLANVHHRNQQNCFVIITNVGPGSNGQTVRAQRQEATTEMINCEGTTKKQIEADKRHEHENVQQHESGQVQPTKCPGAELFLANHRPTESEGALEPK